MGILGRTVAWDDSFLRGHLRSTLVPLSKVLLVCSIGWSVLEGLIEHPPTSTKRTNPLHGLPRDLSLTNSTDFCASSCREALTRAFAWRVLASLWGFLRLLAPNARFAPPFPHLRGSPRHREPCAAPGEVSTAWGHCRDEPMSRSSGKSSPSSPSVGTYPSRCRCSTSRSCTRHGRASQPRWSVRPRIRSTGWREVVGAEGVAGSRALCGAGPPDLS